jgi:hypothetical protein
MLGFFLFFRIRNVPSSDVKNEKVGVVSALSPDVHHRSAYGVGDVLVEKQADVYQGSLVETSSNGRAFAELVSGAVITVDFNSEVVISLAKESSTRLRLTAGQVWSRVEKIFEQGEFYEIELPDGVALVRGTSFNASYKDGKSSVHVESGTVLFIPIDKQTEERLIGAARTVNSGEKATIKDGEVSLSRVKISDADEWYSFNIEQALIPAEGRDVQESNANMEKVSTSTNVSPATKIREKISPQSPTTSGRIQTIQQESLEEPNKTSLDEIDDDLTGDTIQTRLIEQSSALGEQKNTQPTLQNAAAITTDNKSSSVIQPSNPTPTNQPEISEKREIEQSIQ